MDPLSGVDAHEPPTSERLVRNRDRIVLTWMALVRHHVESAATEDDETVRDSLPEFLDLLAEGLESGSIDQAASQEVSRKHAEQRSRLRAYSVEQVFLEYRLLRRTLFEVLESEGPVSPRDRDFLHEAIDVGIGQAGAAFMRVQLSQSEGSVRQLEAERGRREEFIATLSHDLRNPLTVARVCIQLLVKESGMGRRIVELAGKALRNLERIDRMTLDFLDAKRIHAGEKLPLTLTDCELVEIVRETADELAPLHGGRLVLKAGEPVRGCWSRDGLRRVLINLVGNGFKYGTPGTPVTVSVVGQDDRAVLTVHNQGQPLSAEDERTMFEPFHRSATAERSGARGWGLGLTLVRGVVEAHGGNVRAESSPDGVSFVVTLPKDARPFQRA